MRALLLAVVALLGGSAIGSDSAKTKFGALMSGSAMPDFSAIGADGHTVNLSDFRGRVVVLNVWATNRGPADILENVHAQYQALGVAVVGLCANATRDEFDAWMKRHNSGASYPMLWDPAAKTRSESIAQKHLGLVVLPATMVIDREGKFVGGFVGFGAPTAPILRGYLRDAGVAIPAEVEPVRSAPPPREDRTLKPGTIAPDFACDSPDGKEVKLSSFAGKIVV